jgi:hypothetical protein
MGRTEVRELGSGLTQTPACAKIAHIFLKEAIMKRSLLFVIMFLAISTMVFAMGGSAPSGSGSSGNSNLYMIDDFEDGDYSSNPEWWKFDNVNPQVVGNVDYQNGDPVSLAEIKKYSCGLTGSCTDWYCGGMGTYIARKGVDLSRFNTFQMDVYGNGPGSGSVKVELNDDDNGNWQVEQDPKKGFANIYDDKFVYNLIVDWRGWKRVSIPIADFTDENPGIGDDIWNPNQEGGSGGLVQMQMVFVGPKKAGNIRFNIDNVSLTVK